ncbi:MAG TPA: hypothetical protein DCY89_05615 [Gammaproteobacteria bacterium]|nr:hypothetical protein [Gammaproteobacteria bacterium]
MSRAPRDWMAGLTGAQVLSSLRSGGLRLELAAGGGLRAHPVRLLTPWALALLERYRAEVADELRAEGRTPWPA